MYHAKDIGPSSTVHGYVLPANSSHDDSGNSKSHNLFSRRPFFDIASAFRMVILYLAVGIELVVLTAVSWAAYMVLSGTYVVDTAKLRARMVDTLGDFVADVLEHPRVKLAMAESVRNGMNHTIEQPDLGSRLRKVSEYMAEDNLHMSRSIGEQLPGLAASFMSGAVSSITGKKTKTNIHAIREGSRMNSMDDVSKLRLSLGGSNPDDAPHSAEGKKAN
jgi:hypothetical protein